MKTLSRALLACLLLVLPLASSADADAGPVIALRAFFTAVVNGDDKGAWGLFSRHTKDGIVKSVADSEHMDKAEVRKLFDSAAPQLHEGFWASFHSSSQAETFVSVQMDSTGPSKDAPGSVLITMPNGSSVTMLMYREGGAWKVGWFETFFPGGAVVPAP